MFTHKQTYLEKAFLSAVAVLLLLTTAGQSAMLTDTLQTTETPVLSNSSLTTELNNSSMEQPRVLRTYRSCGSEHENWCENGGECMYPQDTDKPYCICTASYGGERCMFIVDHTRTVPETEQLIAIIFGALMVICVLAIMICCFACKRCKKSAPLIKSEPSESSV